METVLKSVAAVVAVCLVLIVMSAVLVAVWTLIKRGAKGVADAGSARSPHGQGSASANSGRGSGPVGGGDRESD